MPTYDYMHLDVVTTNSAPVALVAPVSDAPTVIKLTPTSEVPMTDSGTATATLEAPPVLPCSLGTNFERFESILAAARTTCENCGKPVERLIGRGCGVIIKK